MFPNARETNLTAASRIGTTLTADVTQHTEAAGWTEIIASTDAQSDELSVLITNVSTTAADTGVLLDVAYGDVGGGNEVVVISDLLMGEASTGNSLGRFHTFPISIPTTKSVSARIRATVSGETAVCAIALGQGCVHMESVGVATAYGVNTAASTGTSVPSGSGAFGAWTEIGTTSADHNIFIPSYDSLGDTSINGTVILVQMGYGATAPDAGGTAINAYWRYWTDSAEAISGPYPAGPVYADVASGTKLWARIAGNDTENRGIAIYGMEGTIPSGGSTVLVNRDSDMDIRQAGSTDQSVTIHMVTTADGTADTGVAHTDITTAYYARENSAAVQITPANLAAINSAHSDGGWEEYSSTNLPGDYRLDLPDAAVAAGVNRVKIVVQTATSRGELTIDITADNPRAAAMTTADILTAATADPIAANVQEINDVTVAGAGTSGDKWTAA